MISQVLSTMPQDALWGSYAAQCQAESCLQLLAVCLQRCEKRSDALHMGGIFRDLREHSTRCRQRIYTRVHSTVCGDGYHMGKKICTHAITVAVEEPVCACCLLVCEGKVLERFSPSRALRQAGEGKMWGKKHFPFRFLNQKHQTQSVGSDLTGIKHIPLYVSNHCARVLQFMFINWILGSMSTEKGKAKTYISNVNYFLNWLITGLVFKVSMSVFRCLYFITDRKTFSVLT